MLAQNHIFFYILFFSLIITSFLMIFLPRFSQMIFTFILFLFSTTILYFGFNSSFLVFFHILISVVALTFLLIIVHRITGNLNEKPYKFPVKKFLAGSFIFIFALILIGMFIFYFSNAAFNPNMIAFYNKNELSPLITFFITARIIFTDYFLAYCLIIITFIAVLTGVSILISTERQIKNNEEKNNAAK